MSRIDVIRIGIIASATVCAVSGAAGGCRNYAPIESNTKRMVDLEAYDRALTRCRALGKRYDSLAIYDTCAEIVDDVAGVTIIDGGK